MHPLASFCQKVLIAFYENDTSFEPRIVDLADETSRAEFLNIWPIGRMPVPECVNNFETPVVGSLVSNAALPRVRVAWVLES